ncbi:MAG: SixA phosphatase family protein [Candidatus Polarisedimenticolia bacterium]
MAQTPLLWSRMAILYLMRHGPADGPGDDPPLSAVGVRLMTGASRGLAHLGVTFDAIYCSPLRRALATASLMTDSTRPGPGVCHVLQEAGPGARLKPLAAALGARHAGGSVLVVGHQPDMGLMAMEAIGARVTVPFGKGTLCGVETPGWADLIEGRPGVLSLLVPAALLAAIAVD